MSHISKVRWPTDFELRQLNQAVKDLDIERTKLWFDHPDPWLCLDVWVHMKGELKFALWRETGAVYRVKPRGDVEDDPIVPGV